MPAILAAILYLLLYALVSVLAIELVLLILGLFIAVPPKVRTLLYAIVGVLLLIWLLGVIFAGLPYYPAPTLRR